MRDRKGDLIKRYCGTSDPEVFHITRSAKFIESLDSESALTSKHHNKVCLPNRTYIPRKARAGAGLLWLKLFADYDGDQCLLFPFRTAYSPRGRVTYNFKEMEAHRAMCLHVHRLPKDATKTMALHSCGNGHLGCVNPNHLYWGDQSDNVKDAHRHRAEGKKAA